MNIDMPCYPEKPQVFICSDIHNHKQTPHTLYKRLQLNYVCYTTYNLLRHNSSNTNIDVQALLKLQLDNIHDQDPTTM